MLFKRNILALLITLFLITIVTCCIEIQTGTIKDALPQQTNTVINTQIAGASDSKEDDGFRLRLKKGIFSYYYCASDEECIKDIVKALEQGHKKLCKDLDYQYESPVIVEIYHTRADYARNCMDKRCGYSSIGISWHNKMQVMSPITPDDDNNLFDYDSLLMTPVHELAHLIIQEADYGIPLWLNEAVAYYESGNGNFLNKLFLSQLQHDISTKHIPSFDDLANGTEGFAPLPIYSYAIASFIAEEYSVDKLGLLVKSPKNFKGIFNASEKEFHKKLVKYLEKNYSSN